MAKFARPNSYTGKQSNQNWTGSTRAANSTEASAGIKDQIYIAPATLQTAARALILTAAPAAAAGASPLTSDAKIGQVIFSGVSIAAGASQTFTVNNSTITADNVTNPILVQMYGATDGAALNIKSVTPAAGSFAVVINNGTGATTTTANITITYEILG